MNHSVRFFIHFLLMFVTQVTTHQLVPIIVVHRCSTDDEAIGPNHFLIPEQLGNSSDENSQLVNLTFSGQQGFRCESDQNPYKFEFDLLPNDDKSSVQFSKITFLSTGQLTHQFDEIQTTLYNMDEFCVELIPFINESTIEVHICLSKCDPIVMEISEELIEDAEKFLPKNHNEICVQKCCPPDHLLDFTDTQSPDPKCTKVTHGGRWWTPTFYDSNSLENFCITKKPDADNYWVKNSYRIFVNSTFYPAHFESSRRFTANYTFDRMSFRLLEDGRLVTRNIFKSPFTLLPKWYPVTTTFCVDGGPHLSSTSDEESATYEYNDHEFYAVEETDEEFDICLDNSTQRSADDSPRHVLLAANAVSLLPLSCTILVYLFTWTSQTIHGWIIFAHISSLFFLNFFLVVGFSINLGQGSQESTSCKIVGIIAHFFFLSTFFWLTVVNFDLWRKLRSFNQVKSRRKDLWTFLVYGLFSWGGPLIIIIIGIVLDAKYGVYGYEDNECEILTPNYGHQRCFYSEESAAIYLYYIIGILMSINLILVISTFRNLYIQKQSTKSLLQDCTHQAISWKLFAKLFTVMGVSLCLEFVTWACGAVTKNYNEVEEKKTVTGGLKWFLVITDFLNWTTRAVLIFLIFGFKKMITLTRSRKPTIVKSDAVVPLSDTRSHATNDSGGGHRKMSDGQTNSTSV